ncbi:MULTISPECIES: PAS domain-containing hybrid sensor histidine kinase/response regulator [Legionella]|uniref:histidine kinase n=1 Tax=Legionella maceachernii TaxID=466 RepID=A0A0W0WBF0_9GAMM|nr:ATP-binding protein [Legionella maceachernii]KTD29648.1 sensory box sensor histidine kinase/response regulator [Legionella maceachernii]SKA20768.1 PAS fold-containing protein [Legionella maceachernii]SUP02651.1 Autoinducer 2 sensor kinase/phosphatase luxQ [Legionella maceachernii]
MSRSAEQNNLISSLKEAILQLEIENKYLKHLIDNLPGDIYWKDTKGRWLGVNKRGCQTLKKMGFITNSSEVVGKTDYELFDKKIADQFRSNDLMVMEKKVEHLYEEINILPSGKKVNQLSIKNPIYNHKGEIMGVVGNTIDITPLKQKTLNLKSAKEKAEKANRMKTEFIDSMSHDLRTPLSGIIGMAKFLEQTICGQNEKKYAQLLYESGEQLLALFNDILQLRSADSMKVDIQYETFNLSKSINALVALVLPAAKLKNIDIKINIDSEMPTYIISDQNKLYRILLNLLGNAIKFTAKGYVEIEIKLLKKERKNVQLRFSIHDTGIGIRKESHQKVFERFHSVNVSNNIHHEGFGMGLQIAEKYAKLLGSRIQFESEFNKGSTFYFDLSLKRENIEKNSDTKSTQSSKQRESTLSPLNPKNAKNSLSKVLRILLVEDNPVILFFLEQAVKKMGYKINSVNNAEDAFLLVMSEDFDIIITDIRLPNSSGIELSQRIRKWEAANNRPPVFIFAMTGYSEQALSNYRKSGINKIITKPIDPEIIQSLLSELN